MRRLLLATALATLTATHAGAQDAEAMLDRASAAHGALKSLKVAFEQVIQNPLTGSSVTARGEMLQKGPKLLAIHFSQPKGDQIISDGQNLWIFLPSSTPGQVFRLTLGAQSNAVAGSVDVLSQFFNEPRKRFDVKDAGTAPIDGKDARALILTPKKGVEAPFAKAVVWIDARSAYVRQFETTDASGLVRTVKVTRFGANAKVNDTEFRFVVPNGVRVVEQPGM
ncbi:MAG: outer membrane lipoprotein carrier protein LolA [Gemmatimonadetes bacterium]|nr:outer membrane lipoprotein carrier protein LolA [Gemmatimonadota bacterium]